MKFAYWSREVAGWLLILAGLYAFWEAYNSLLNHRILEAGPLTFVGFIVFRGGVHVLKVAVAAQTALAGQAEAAQPAARKIGRLPTRSVGPTPSAVVKPGPKTARTGAATDRG
jgi:hypothetical protein